jgi:hypothetical protein
MAVTDVTGREGARYNRLAAASLVLAGLASLGLVFMSISVLAVFAVGAGHVALAQIQRRGERGRELAIAALAIGYAIAVLGLVSSLYFAVSLAVQQGG